MTGVGQLRAQARYPGRATSQDAIDFIIPGLPDLHFCAWGTGHGSVAIACAQVPAAPPESPTKPAAGGGAGQSAAQPLPLHSALVLTLRQVPAASGHSSRHNSHNSTQGRPVDEPVLHVTYGGGPLLLLAACTEQWLVWCSLEPFAAGLFSMQTGGSSGNDDAVSAGEGPARDVQGQDAKPEQEEAGSGAALQVLQQHQQQQPAGAPLQETEQQLHTQLAAVHCRGSSIIGLSWTQQLDGLLVSHADGSLAMWHLQPAAEQTGAPSASLGSGSSLKERHPGSAAPVQVAPDVPLAAHGAAAPAAAAATAVPRRGDAAAGWALVPAWQAKAPAPQLILSAGASISHPSASSSRCNQQERGANLWWPLLQAGGSAHEQAAGASQERPGEQGGQQQQQPRVAGARREWLKHPCLLSGLEWSPDAISSHQTDFGGPGEGVEGTFSAWDRHQALMTVGTDGVIRIWVEMVVVVHLPSGSEGDEATPPPTPRSPAVESCFCMALVVEPPSLPRPPPPAAAPSVPAVHATWGRLPGCALGRDPQHAGRAPAAPVLWLLSTAAPAPAPGQPTGQSVVRAHLVRGLAPVVMVSHGGTMSSSGGGGGGSPRPQALLWGQRTWGLAGADPTAATACGSSSDAASSDGGKERPGHQLGVDGQVWTQQVGRPQHLSCWVTDEDDYPRLHVFWSGPLGGSEAVLRVQGCTLATIDEDSPGSPRMHRRLALLSSWHAQHAMHAEEVCALHACPTAPLLASLDAGGTVLLWHSLPGGELQAVGTLSTAFLATAAAAAAPAAPAAMHALAWAPAAPLAGSRDSDGWAAGLLVAATSTQLLFLVTAGQQAQQAGVTGQLTGPSELGSGTAWVPGWQLALVAAWDLPSSLPAVQVLHVLTCDSSSPASAGLRRDGSGGGQLLVAAICGGAGSCHAASVFLQRVSVEGQAPAELRVSKAWQQGQQEQQVEGELAKAVHAFPAVVMTSAAVAGLQVPGGAQGWLLAGLTNGIVQVLQVGGSDPGGAQVIVVAELAILGAPAVVAAAPCCEYIVTASSGDQDVLQVWRQLPLLGGSHGTGNLPSIGFHLEASVTLPDTPTSLAWLGGLAAPAVAVGCSAHGVLVLAKGSRTQPAAGAVSQGGWSRLAQLPGSQAPSGVSCLCLLEPLGASSLACLAAAGGGGELFTLSPAVRPQVRGGPPACTLARWVLDQAGPLPQYHPAVLAALTLAGKLEAVTAVLHSLLTWLLALRQRAAATQQGGEGGSLLDGREGPGAAGLPASSPPAKPPLRGLEGSGTAVIQAPTYMEVPLAKLVGGFEDAQQVATAAASYSAANTPLPTSQAETRGAASLAAGRGLDSCSLGQGCQPAQQQSLPGSDGAAPHLQLNTGQLDMGAFGMDSFGVSPQPAPAAPAQTVTSRLETGHLDMSAFGTDSSGGMAAASRESPASSQARPGRRQPQAAPLIDTGQLDLGAFGMDGFGASAAESHNAGPGQPAAKPLETGQLDMAAFGLDSFAAAAPQPAAARQQPAAPQGAAAGAVETGQLDLAAFGMGAFGGEPPPGPVLLQVNPPPASSPAGAVDSGLLDMAAFGLGGFGGSPANTAQAPAAPLAPAATAQRPLLSPAATGSGWDASPPAATTATSVAGAAAAAGRHPQAAQRPLPNPSQQLVPAEQLHPLTPPMAEQLAAELASWRRQQAAHEEPAAADGVTWSTAAAQPALENLAAGGGPADAGGLSFSRLGLTFEELDALLAFVRAMAPHSTSRAGTAGAPVDTCTAHFLRALALALASSAGAGATSYQQQQQQGSSSAPSTAPGQPGSSASSAGRGLGGPSQLAGSNSLGQGSAGTSSNLFQGPVSLKNAAGVEFTVPPASSAARLVPGGQADRGASTAPLEEEWGLQPGLSTTAVLWAVLSGTQQALLDSALGRVQQAHEAAKAEQAPSEATFLAVKPPDMSQQASWEALRALGAGFWLTDPDLARSVAERLAKAQFAARRSADDCALLYCALGKTAVLQGLYRTTQNRRLADFLSRDFSQPANRQAASKNAFVLLGQHRHSLAAAFFILGGAPEDAVGVCAHEMHDPQLALLVCRLLWGPGSAAERRVLERDLLPAVLQQYQDGRGSPWSGSAGRDSVGQQGSLAPGSANDALPLRPSLAGPAPGAGSGAVTAAGTLLAAAEPSLGGGAAPAAAAAGGKAAPAEALCRWLLGDAAGAVVALLGGGSPATADPGGLPASAQQAGQAAADAAQLLPLLGMMLPVAQQASPGRGGSAGLPARHQLLRLVCLRCLAAADVLQRSGMPALALSPALAARKAEALAAAEPRRMAGQEEQKEERGVVQGRLEATAALCLLRHVMHAVAQQPRSSWRGAALGHLSELQQLGLKVDTDAVLCLLRPMVRQLATSPSAIQPVAAFLLGPGHPRSLQPQHSLLSRSSVHSVRSAGSASSRGAQRTAGGQGPAPATAGMRCKAVAGTQEGAVDGPLREGHVLFRVDGDRSEAVACCPLLSPESPGGRPLVLATKKHGLVEGEVLLVPGGPPGGEVTGGDEAYSASVAGSDAGSQRGSLFTRLINQVFDQSRWESEDYLDSLTSEGELSTTVAGAMLAAEGGLLASGFGGSGPASGSIVASAVCAHPTRNLFLSGCASGRVHLWQFGGRQALASFTPVPPADLAETRGSSFLSFSARLRGSPATGKLASWGRCAALRFSANGERFAAAGEGGVVATWRLDAPRGPGGRPGDTDGAACADCWHQGLAKGARAVEYVGGSSSVVAVGGRGAPGEGHIALWDTLAPPSSAGVGRLGQHQVPVTALCMLPGGWLLSSSDEAGALSVSDIRMMGGGKGPRVLWSVRAAHGSIASIAWAARGAASSSGRGHDPTGLGFLHGVLAASRSGQGFWQGGLVTGGQDGAVRVWQPADGQLVQSVEFGRQGAAGERPGSAAAAVTGVTACPEGVVVCCADGAVRLLPYS